MNDTLLVGVVFGNLKVIGENELVRFGCPPIDQPESQIANRYAILRGVYNKIAVR